MRKEELKDVRRNGNINFIVGVCRKMGFGEIINNSLEKCEGRTPYIPYGIVAEIMIVNLCDDHKPLSRLKEYLKKLI